MPSHSAVIETRILEQLTPRQVEYMKSRVPLGSLGRPEEVAARHRVSGLRGSELRNRPVLRCERRQGHVLTRPLNSSLDYLRPPSVRCRNIGIRLLVPINLILL